MCWRTLYENKYKYVNKAWALLQKTKDEPSVIFYVEIVTDITPWNSERKYT